MLENDNKLQLEKKLNQLKTVLFVADIEELSSKDVANLIHIAENLINDCLDIL